MTTKTPMQECEKLMNKLLPFAKRMLQEHGQFLPFGGTMSRDGTIVCTGAHDGREQSSLGDLIQFMRQDAKRGNIKACAIVSDVRAVPPDSEVKTNAVWIQLDHVTHYFIEVFLPYCITHSNKVYFGGLYTRTGQTIIFDKLKTL